MFKRSTLYATVLTQKGDVDMVSGSDPPLLKAVPVAGCPNHPVLRTTPLNYVVSHMWEGLSTHYINLQRRNGYLIVLEF